MNHILVAFSTKTRSPLGWLTRFFTRWRHSHVALVSDDVLRLIEASDEWGVREAPATSLLGRDDVEIRKIAHPNPQGVWDACLTQIGKPYDEWYSLGWLCHRNWQNPDQWACHELIEWACRQAGHGLFPADATYLTPRDLYLISEPI